MYQRQYDVHRSTGKISSKHYRNIGSANIKKLKTLNIPSQHTPMFPLESSFCIRMLSRKLLSESTVKLSWDCSKTDRLKYGRHRRSFKSMEHWMDKETYHLPLHGSYWATQLACGLGVWGEVCPKIHFFLMNHEVTKDNYNIR